MRFLQAGRLFNRPSLALARRQPSRRLKSVTGLSEHFFVTRSLDQATLTTKRLGTIWVPGL